MVFRGWRSGLWVQNSIVRAVFVIHLLSFIYFLLDPSVFSWAAFRVPGSGMGAGDLDLELAARLLGAVQERLQLHNLIVEQRHFISHDVFINEL